jgi:hypothetical protein
MIGMRVGDDRARDRGVRVDMEITGTAVKTARVDGEPGIELFSFHERLW